MGVVSRRKKHPRGNPARPDLSSAERATVREFVRWMRAPRPTLSDPSIARPGLDAVIDLAHAGGLDVLEPRDIGRISDLLPRFGADAWEIIDLMQDYARFQVGNGEDDAWEYALEALQEFADRYENGLWAR
jgi:hypothetical protein